VLSVDIFKQATFRRANCLQLIHFDSFTTVTMTHQFVSLLLLGYYYIFIFISQKEAANTHKNK